MEGVEKSTEEITRLNSASPDSNDAESLENNENGEETKRKRLNKTEKKQLKFQRLLEKYKQRKEEKKKQKEHEKLEKQSIQNETVESEEKEKSSVLYETYYNKRELKKLMLERLRKCYQEENSNKLKICIDCAFVEHMSDKELSRLSQQIGRCYATNKTLATPVYLTLANLSSESKLFKELCRVNDGFANYFINRTEKTVEDYFGDAIGSVAYLSPDAPAFLEAVDASATYVIGGLVDETVTKKVTLSKCEEKEIKSYALPIEKYMRRKVTSDGQLDSKNYNYNKILTINQVFDILTNKFEGKDWPEALEVGVPRRKGFYAEKKKEDITNSHNDS